MSAPNQSWTRRCNKFTQVSKTVTLRLNIDFFKRVQLPGLFVTSEGILTTRNSGARGGFGSVACERPRCRPRQPARVAAVKRI